MELLARQRQQLQQQQVSQCVELKDGELTWCILTSMLGVCTLQGLAKPGGGCCGHTHG